MNLTLVALILGLLAMLLASWAVFRRRVHEGDFDGARRREAEERAARSRVEIQRGVALQLQPLQQALGDLVRAQASGQEQALRLQVEKAAEGFRQLGELLQVELRQARRDQGDQLQQVQLQVEGRLAALQQSNEERLERMRLTVDDKLHQTLDRRLGESFNLVAERLEQVQKGLGEMQGLAQDVGGLKRALTNVKTRGILGEAQLGALLDQFLAPGQFEANVKVKPRSAERVEFAVKLPGPEAGTTVWLPIDAKFPLEDYQRLSEAYETGDLAQVEASGKALETRLLTQGREIRDKYLAPPDTTDFALLFLPFEGLYAEALRRPGLLERLQRDCRVTFVGPTTLTAFLNSLQVGFKTLAITRQSGEVWKVLGQVKTEFGKFGAALHSVETKLGEASRRLGEVSHRREQMVKHLAGVEAMPALQEQPECNEKEE